MQSTTQPHPEERLRHQPGTRLEGCTQDLQRRAQPLAVYIHWPFCRSKCPYCDFNSHVRDGVDAARWTRALTRDLAHHAALTVGREVGTVFFGGGTPSLMPPETVAALLDGVRSHWAVVPDLE